MLYNKLSPTTGCHNSNSSLENNFPLKHLLWRRGIFSHLSMTTYLFCIYIFPSFSILPSPKLIPLSLRKAFSLSLFFHVLYITYTKVNLRKFAKKRVKNRPQAGLEPATPGRQSSSLLVMPRKHRKCLLSLHIPSGHVPGSHAPGTAACFLFTVHARDSCL